MSEIGDGGPAFPCDTPTEGPQFIERGMSLRDYFAGQAMAGMAANHHMYLHYREVRGSDFTNVNFSQDLVRSAYRTADVMLAARKAVPA